MPSKDRKFSTGLNVIVISIMLSLNLFTTAFANAPSNPEHRRCQGYYDYYEYERCQGYYGYHDHPYYYQGCEGPGCPGSGYTQPGVPYNQGCEGPGCPSSQPNSGTSASTGPDNASMLGSGSATLAAGAQQWYSFPVQPPLNSDNSRGTLGMDVTLRNLSGRANFQVLTSELVNQWKNDVQYSPLGAGSEDRSPQGEPIYFWHGSFGQPLTLYIVVSNNTDQPATYTLSFNTRRE